MNSPAHSHRHLRRAALALSLLSLPLAAQVPQTLNSATTSAPG